MTPRQIIGLILLIGGVILQPMGWMFEWWLAPVSVVLVLIGVGILMKARELDTYWSGVRSGSSGGGGTDRPIPGDIHGYSGQMHGGRSSSWESSHHGGGWDAHGGGSDGGAD